MRHVVKLSLFFGATAAQQLDSVRSSWTPWPHTKSNKPETDTSPPSVTYTTNIVYTESLTPQVIEATSTSCSRPVPSESRSIPFASPTTMVASTIICPTVQAKPPPPSDPSRADAIREAYIRSWSQYSTYCFGRDSFFVTNKTCIDDFGGWGVTIVDSLDTAIIMHLNDIASTQLEHIASIDFTISVGEQPVNAFETTIRYLGGLLSAYDLLKSGFAEPGTYNEDHVDALLEQAIILANQLDARFNTPTGLPAEKLYWGNKTYEIDNFDNDINNVTYNSSNVAVCGTLILEYYRLADLTGDWDYRATADRVTEYLITFGDEYTPVYPNLVGAQLDLDRGNYLTYDLGWKAGIDSFFEYLLKVPVYDPSSDQRYLKFWYDAVLSSQANIAVSPYNAPGLTYLTEADVCGDRKFSMDDYACFAGGNILLGARYLEHLDRSNADAFQSLALAVTESCFHLYNTTLSGFGPKQWAWFDAPNHTYNESWTTNATYQTSQQERDYFILDTQYDSFPESIESFWYAYRLTGQQIYAEWNWQIFQSILNSKDSMQDIVYAGIMDVDQPATLFKPELPSFYLAEVLKYLYLTFTNASVISLDEWVFNTEAHPFRIGGGCKK